MTRNEELEARALRIAHGSGSHGIFPLGDEIKKALLHVEWEVFQRVIDRIETMHESTGVLREWCRQQKEAL